MASYAIDLSIDDDVVAFAKSQLAGLEPWLLDRRLLADRLQQLVAFVLAAQQVACDAEVSLALVGTERIHRLNRDYRGVDAPTDVLSFPCDDPAGFCQGQLAELGDIVLAPQVVLAQTAEFGTTFVQEARLLVVHSLLHLLGYDHVEDEEAETMEARERELLAAWAQRQQDASPAPHAQDLGPLARGSH